MGTDIAIEAADIALVKERSKRCGISNKVVEHYFWVFVKNLFIKCLVWNFILNLQR